MLKKVIPSELAKQGDKAKGVKPALVKKAEMRCVDLAKLLGTLKLNEKGLASQEELKVDDDFAGRTVQEFNVDFLGTRMKDLEDVASDGEYTPKEKNELRTLAGLSQKDVKKFLKDQLEK